MHAHLNNSAPLYSRLTLVHMHVEYRRYVEECCSSVLDELFAGDISPYGDAWITTKMVVTCLSLFLPIYLFPNWFRFTPPPRSSTVRSKTQRRTVPKGFPFRPRENETLEKHYKRFLDRRNQKSEVSHEGATKKERTEGTTDADLSHETPQRLETSSGESADEATLERLIAHVEEIQEQLPPAQNQTVRKSMRWMSKLETERQGALQMSDAELRELWEPCFALQERIYLFCVSPKVLFILNMIFQAAATALFLNLHINLNSQVPTPPVASNTKVHEVVIGLYFFSILLREFFQVLLSNSLVEFCLEGWNVIEGIAIFGFYTGVILRYAGNNPPDGKTEVLLGESMTGVTYWKLSYGLSLSALFLRALRVLSILPRLGLLVVVTLKMLEEIYRWLVVFAIFLFSFSILLFGAGDPRGVLDKCDVSLEAGRRTRGGVTGEAEHYLFASCLQGWWFVRTVRVLLLVSAQL